MAGTGKGQVWSTQWRVITLLLKLTYSGGMVHPSLLQSAWCGCFSTMCSSCLEIRNPPVNSSLSVLERVCVLLLCRWMWEVKITIPCACQQCTRKSEAMCTFAGDRSEYSGLRIKRASLATQCADKEKSPDKLNNLSKGFAPSLTRSPSQGWHTILCWMLIT